MLIRELPGEVVAALDAQALALNEFRYSRGSAGQAGVFSPASTATGRWFPAGGSGQVANSV